MKFICFFATIGLLVITACKQTRHISVDQPDRNKFIQIVEASCSECQFNLAGTGCKLAVRIEGKVYFVDGTGIDDHGDPHAADGFCKAIRTAQVQGDVVNNRFKATYFKLADSIPKKK